MLSDGERAALQFSGGKDSTALLYLARPFLDRITVYFADTGAVFPHMRQYVEETCARLGARLEIVLPPRTVHEHIDAVGLPSDLVPVEAALEMQPMLREGKRVLVQSYLSCCGAMIWQPMERALRAAGERVTLRGAKRGDARVGRGPHFWHDGVEYRHPIWEWGDARVMAFLESEGVRLPEQYPEVPDSLDCWICTAHLSHRGPAKMRWMKRRYPELWAQTRPRVALLETAIDEARAPLARILSGDP